VLSRFVRDAATAAARQLVLRIPSLWGKSAIMEGSWLQFDLEHLALVTGEFQALCYTDGRLGCR
jgi:hypothetical protein